MHSFYLDQIRTFEGYTPRATWDYAQLSNGYGTRARYAGEVIDRAEAERRFQAEVGKARAIVEKAAPHVDEGTKAALTSLTYNAGTAWIDGGLGDAIRRGDLEAARAIFQQYNKAGGEVLPGLVSRRAQEALWIGNPETVTGTSAVGGAGESAPLPPVIVAGDGDTAAAPVRTARPMRTEAWNVASGAADPFERGPRSERAGGGATLGHAASAALLNLAEAERLGPGGVADMTRLLQLGQATALTRPDRERQGQERQTQRV